MSAAANVCIVTGANTGIGRVTAEQLAEKGYRVFLACRSLNRTRPVLDAIRARHGDERAHFLPLDLGDLASVRKAAATFLDLGLPLPLLVNNAGLASQRGVTADGFERAFGVNHLGHFLLTALLLDRVRESAPARVVTVASQAHQGASGIPFDRLRQPTASLTGYPEYQVSKLANVLFSAELARRLQGSGVTTYALHPGVIASEIWRRIPRPFRSLLPLVMRSPEDGAKTTLHCCLSAQVASETGLYYDECKVKPPSPEAADRALAAELWRKSEQWSGVGE